MVPAYLLLVALPLVAGGMSAEQMNMMKMMMMNNMNGGNAGNMMNGGNNNMMDMMSMYNNMNNMNNMNQNQNQQQPNFSMQNKEEYDAYLKWCEESRARQAEQSKQQELLEAWKKRQEEQEKEKEKMKLQMEAHEREENMKNQWKQWEQKMQMAQNFDTIGYEVMEMKHKYYYMVVMSFLQFCKCSDFAGEIKNFFHHDGVDTSKYEEFDLTDLGLTAAQSNDPAAVARALNGLSQGDQIKAFFGGLSESLCDGAKSYYDQVHQWEEQYKFLERLV